MHKERIKQHLPAFWKPFYKKPDIILFEGWCVGTKPQKKNDLYKAINPLEENEDEDGKWRWYVNNQLKKNLVKNQLMRQL